MFIFAFVSMHPSTTTDLSVTADIGTMELNSCQCVLRLAYGQFSFSCMTMAPGIRVNRSYIALVAHLGMPVTTIAG